MDNNDVFPPWGDLDDGKPSVWACDWIIDDGQAKEDIFLTIAYDYREEFILKYNQILEAAEKNTVKELLSTYIKEEIHQEDLDEIADFFNRWLDIVEADGKIEMIIDDENIDEVDEDFTESENRTLH